MIEPPPRDAGLPRAMPPLAAAYLVTGIGWLATGVGIGIAMGMAHDFTLRPVHAHINLLGWATNALFGCFYWLRGGAARRAEWLGFAVFNAGTAAMQAGLAAQLLDKPAPPALLLGGVVLIAVGIAQMVVTLLGNLPRRAGRRAVAHA